MTHLNKINACFAIRILFCKYLDSTPNKLIDNRGKEVLIVEVSFKTLTIGV